MDVMLIEIVLWCGLLFFFWALKDGLGNVESDIESLGLIPNIKQAMQTQADSRYAHPEQVSEPIGSYRDAAIYRFAVIQGKTYQFDRVMPPGVTLSLDADERCVEPGLVYRECRNEA